jgi:hypothetical protein
MIAHCLQSVADEVERAEAKFAPFNSGHEGYAVIKEELDELWEHVKGNTAYSVEAYNEAKQVAAMGIRYMRMIEERV